MKLSILGILAVSGAIFSCEHTPQLTPQQLRAIQTRTLQASYRSVFLAIKDVLQDDGYHIHSQDYKGGLMVAKKEIDGTKIKIFGLVLTEKDPEELGTTYKLSFNIESISKSRVRTRITIVGITRRSNGQHQAVDISDPQIYQVIYRNLQLELKRRQARS